MTFKTGPVLVLSRWNLDDGTGGTCAKCDRYFGTKDALEDHQEFCSDLLEKKNKAAEKTGVFEQVDDEDQHWSDGRNCEYLAWSYAEISLTHFRKQYPDRHYNLVKPGCYNIVGGSSAPLVHLNFKAKPYDGPVETFFAQLRTYCLGPSRGQRVVHCCLSLGASQYLPPSGSSHYSDCNYCTTPIRHPAEVCEGLDLGYYWPPEVPYTREHM